MYKQVLKEPKVARKIDKIVFLVFIISLFTVKNLCYKAQRKGEFFSLF